MTSIPKDKTQVKIVFKALFLHSLIFFCIQITCLILSVFRIRNTLIVIYIFLIIVLFYPDCSPNSENIPAMEYL